MPLGQSKGTNGNEIKFLAYADGVILVGDIVDNINRNTETITDDSKKVDLETNGEKTR
jgi:hypothetical protein